MNNWQQEYPELAEGLRRLANTRKMKAASSKPKTKEEMDTARMIMINDLKENHPEIYARGIYDKEPDWAEKIKWRG